MRFGLAIAAARISALLVLVWPEQTNRQTISGVPLVFLLYPEGLLLPYRAGAGTVSRVIVLSVLLIVGSLAAVALVSLLSKQLSR
jgi:hypothetical protein